MPARWTVLGSGSSGNASLLELDGQGLFVDVGLGPRQLEQRLGHCGLGWSDIRGVILTHTHADHWSARSLAKLAELRIPFFCHSEHLRPLNLACPEFQKLQFAGLAKTYDAERDFSPLAGMHCRALPLNHDGGATFGFRIEADPSPGSPAWAVGYAADLGSWDSALARDLADVDILAVEFNHDVGLQRGSGRAPWLVRRVLGDYGHLSNEQGAELLDACAGQTPAGRLRHVIQLHLSRDCNRPALAVAAARDVIASRRLKAELHTASQDHPGPTLVLANGTPHDVGSPGAAACDSPAFS